MTTQTIKRTKPGVVQRLRGIRDDISREIKDMTFEQQRAYLDTLLADAKAANDRPNSIHSKVS